MRIEINENAGWTLVAIAAITAICVGSLVGCNQYEQTRREAIKAGLVEQNGTSSQHTIWTKPD